MTEVAQVNLFAALGERATIASPTHRVAVRAHTRRVDGPPPPTGTQLRDEALEKLTRAEGVQTALAYVREQLKLLYLQRRRDPRGDPASVNADDAAEILRGWAEAPPEVHAVGQQYWRGQIFRAKGWHMTGTLTTSTRAKMRATATPNWYYDGPLTPSDIVP